MQGFDFLDYVWPELRDTHVFLAIKNFKANKFDEFHFVLPAELELVKSFVRGHKKDLYFCPHPFQGYYRRRGEAKKTEWLHADLDEVDPRNLELRPTVAWSTSAGRYQAMWSVGSEILTEELFHKLNRRLTYALGADRGGWSITKVLRVPGTVNGKPEYDEPKVELLWHDGPDYTVKEIVKYLKAHPSTSQSTAGGASDLSLDQILRKYSVPASMKQLINARFAPEGQRSEKLWKIAVTLLELGVPTDELYVVLRDTSWNKWVGFTSEDRQLRAEIARAQKHLDKVKARRRVNGTRSSVTPGKSVFMDYAKFIDKPAPQYLWLVESVWGFTGHGLVAGEPKTYKSLIAQELAFAVASGTKFLGEFDVPEKGPVILIQRENPEHLVADRFQKMSAARGVWRPEDAKVNGRIIEVTSPPKLPIRILPTEIPFDLRVEEDIQMLCGEIESLKPKLVVLDPLYMMARGMDENSNTAVSEVLKTLLDIKNRYKVGILLVHHFNKPREDEGRSRLNRIAGAGGFGRWFESALYLEKGKEYGEVYMIPEHRTAKSNARIKVEVDIGEIGEDHYDLHVEMQVSEEPASSVMRQLEDLIQSTGPDGITFVGAEERLGVNTNRLKRLAKASDLIRVGKGRADGKAGRPAMRMYPVTV